MRHALTRAFQPGATAIEHGPVPVRGPGSVLIRVRCANVTHADRLLVTGGYQLRPPVPFVGGASGVGEIVEGGPDLASGTRVAVLATAFGLWAGVVSVPAWAVVPLPDAVRDAQAAGAIEAYGTAAFALQGRPLLARTGSGRSRIAQTSRCGIGTSLRRVAWITLEIIRPVVTVRERLTAEGRWGDCRSEIIGLVNELNTATDGTLRVDAKYLVTTASTEPPHRRGQLQSVAIGAAMIFASSG